MKPRHRVSRAAIELIARFEGYRRQAAQLPDGRWTIGYGHTLAAREGAEVTQDDAEALLLYDLIAVAHAVNEWTYAPLNQNQFDALASFVFNIGLENFRRSAVLKRLNEGALIQAACAMELWRKAEFAGEKIVIDALVRRRAAEKALFLTPTEGWPAAPTPVLRPLLDVDADGVVPAEPPAPVTATLEGETVHILREDEPVPPPLPPEEDRGPGPVQAAAEAVAARLQTIFAEPEPELAPEPEPEPEPDAQAEAEAEPDIVVEVEADTETTFELVELPPEAEPEPQAGPFGPTFELTSPGEAVLPEAEPEPALADEPEGPPNGELFEAVAAANDLRIESEGESEPAESAGPRIVIDDAAPADFVSPIVQPLSREPKGGGVLSLLALAVLGLAFFGGGVFWALNARPVGAGGPLTPVLVGWLAGLAGVGFFSVAVFLLLQRLAQGHDGRRGG